MSTKARLTASERDSHAWKKVEAVVNERIVNLTKKCTNYALPEKDRFEAAVRVHELSELLKLAQPAEEHKAAAG